jgi:hypothetical protein
LNFGYIPKKGTNISSDKYKALVKNTEEGYTSGKSDTYPDNNFAEESEEEEEEEETEDENTDDEEMTEVSPQKKATPRDFKPTKKYHVMTSKSTGKKISNNEEEEEEEQTEDTPKKRGRPSKQLITVNMDNNIKEEGKTAEDISKKRGRPPKDSCSLKDRKGKFANTQSNWAPIEHEEWDHYSSEEEEPIDPMTGYHPRTGYPWKNYVEVKTEKGEEGKYTSKTSKMRPKQEILSTQNMQDNLALMKLQFEKDPPKNIKVHYETFTIYILEDPLGTSNYFCAVAVLLHTKTRQPSAFLRTVFFREALIGLAAADQKTPAVARLRGALSTCKSVTFRRIEHGTNEVQFHEYNGQTYNHEGVEFMVKRDPKNNNAVLEFVNDIQEILKSPMFFASIHQITLLSPGNGPSMIDMRNSESPVWQYLRNPRNLTVVPMTNLNQILLDEDIVKVLKKMYNRHWTEYFYVGWDKPVKGLVNGEYPIFHKK